MEFRPVKVSRSRGKKDKLSSTLFQITVVSALGSVQYGYNLWVVYSPSVIIQDFYNLTFDENLDTIAAQFRIFMMSVSISSLPIGGIVGALLVGPMVDNFGRKGALMINSFCSIISSMFMASANVVHGTLFALFSRLLIGITIGIFSSAVPLYLGEISPIKMRGVIGMMPHLFLTIGVQVAQILAFREIMGTAEGWPIMMSLSGILALFQIIIVPSFPESPRYLLIQKKNENQAREALQELRNKNDVEDEMEEIRQEEFAERADRNMNSLRLLCYAPLRWQVVSIIILMCGQQLSGVNAIYFYTERIYQTMGVAKDAVRYVSLFSTTAMLLAILCGMYVIETMGRKMLLLIGFGTCSFLCLLLSVTIKLQTSFKWISYFNSLFINIFLIGHAMGPSALPNLLITELFLQSSRSSAYVVGGFIHWLLNFFTVVTFILIQPFLESYTFLICSPICMITFLYSFRMIPETKGRTFLDISKLVPAYVASRMWVKVQPSA